VLLSNKDSDGEHSVGTDGSRRRWGRKGMRVTIRGRAAAWGSGLVTAVAATALLATTTAVAVPAPTDGPVAAGPSGGAAAQAWTSAHDGPQKYPGVHVDHDVPITMSDGVVLKADIYRPAAASGA